jgi:hypothetical protein
MAPDCVSRASAPARRARPKSVTCGSPWASRRTLAGLSQGDDPVQADVPSLVDDAHAAAGDLLQQLVIAEGAQAGPGGRGGDGLAHRLRQALEAVVVGEELRQLGGQLGVPRQQLLPTGGGAFPGRLQVSRNDRVQALPRVHFARLVGAHRSLTAGGQARSPLAGLVCEQRGTVRAPGPFGHLATSLDFFALSAAPARPWADGVTWPTDSVSEPGFSQDRQWTVEG